MVVSQNDSTRVTVINRDSNQSHFYKISEFLIEKTVRLHTKKFAFFALVMIKIGGNFLFYLFSGAVLHFKDQVSSTCIEEDLRLCFH